MDIEEAIFLGVVTSYGSTPGTVIVRRPDKDDRTSAELSVLQRGTHSTKDYWMPSIDDQVLCILIPNAGGKGAGAGFVVSAIYSDADPPPAEANPNTRILNHPGDLILNIGGNLKIAAGNVDIQGGGDATINGISLVSHVHGGILPGGSDTGTPH